jgi:hypothetical protein
MTFCNHASCPLPHYRQGRALSVWQVLPQPIGRFSINDPDALPPPRGRASPDGRRIRVCAGPGSFTHPGLSDNGVLWKTGLLTNQSLPHQVAFKTGLLAVRLPSCPSPSPPCSLHTRSSSRPVTAPPQAVVAALPWVFFPPGLLANLVFGQTRSRR